MRVVLPPAQVKHVRVLTAKLPPLGTFGVRVVVSVEMYSSKSTCKFSSVIMHLVSFGPNEPVSGLMYDMERVSMLSFLASGDQSDI